MITLVVGILNVVGALLPELPGLIDKLKGHPDLSDGGKAALDLIAEGIERREKRIDAIPPLPNVDPERR